VVSVVTGARAFFVSHSCPLEVPTATTLGSTGETATLAILSNVPADWPQIVLGLAFSWGALMGFAVTFGRIDATALALSLAPNYSPGAPRNEIKVAGESAYAAMKLGAWSARQRNYISAYDLVIAEKLAHVGVGRRVGAHGEGLGRWVKAREPI